MKYSSTGNSGKPYHLFHDPQVQGRILKAEGVEDARRVINSPARLQQRLSGVRPQKPRCRKHMLLQNSTRNTSFHTPI